MARLSHESGPNGGSRLSYTLEFSEDLKQLISESLLETEEFLINIRNTSTGSIEQRFELDCSKKWLVALSRDRRLFARTSDDDEITEIVESDSGVIKQLLMYPGSDTESGNFSNDSNLLELFSCEGDQTTINIGSTVAGQLLRKFVNDYSFTEYAGFPNDSRYFAAVYRVEIKIFDKDAVPGTSLVKAALIDWEYTPGRLAFSYDSKILATAQHHKDDPSYRIQIWNTSIMTFRETIYIDIPVKSICFKSDATCLITDLGCIAIQNDESDDRNDGAKIVMDPEYLRFYLSSDFSWIELQGKKIVYIAGDYRRNDKLSAVSRRDIPTAVTGIAICYDPEKCWLMELAETEQSYV